MHQERVKPTLKRTKFACVNCKAAKAACDSNRPCAWCIRHALQDSCVDAPRKTRTSKKICCDPSLHQRNAGVVFKQEFKGSYQLALASDFTPTTSIPLEPPLSPPSDIFPIEDLLAPTFDFGFNNTNNQPCTNCPLYQTCAKDAPQRLICATSSSPPQSPLSPEQLQPEEDVPPVAPAMNVSASFSLPPMSLASHPDFCNQLTPKTPQDSSYSGSPSPNQFSPQQQQSPQQQFPPQVSSSPSTSQQVVTQSQARSLQGCCTFATSPHLPPLLDDVCNCQSLVQREMAKINASLETITALMQLQNGPLLPTATFQVPNTIMEDCNDEFAKALGYEGREDLFASAEMNALAISTKQMMKAKKEGEEDDSTTSKQSKPALTSLLPEKWIPGLMKCANDLQKATLPLVNQMVFSSKRGDNKYFTVLIKPCGWFSYISLLKQHTQLIDGLVVCGE